MGNLSTFGTFTMARLGIYASQYALNVTGNNISNINTEGYTRQNLDQTSMNYGAADRYQTKYDIRANGGVLATGVNQLRDQYLDIRYRNEMTKVGEMDAKLDGLNQLADIFDEVNKGEDQAGVLEARFNELIQAIETQHQDQNTNQDDIDKIVRSAAEALTIQFNDYAKQLQTLRENKTAEFKDQLNMVNTTLTKIRDLNASIRKSEVFGGSALTQRDERNLLIDQLSEKIGINVIYETEKLGDGVEVEKLKISTSGDPERVLVDGIYAAELSIAKTTKAYDANGDEVAAASGSAVRWETSESSNFNLNVSELADAKGNLDPADPNMTKRIFTVQSLGENASDWNKVKDQVVRLAFDNSGGTTAAEKAAAYEKALNEQYGYDSSSTNTPRFHVSNEELTAEEKAAGLYIVHFHPDGDENVYNFANIEDETVTQLNDTELSGGLQAMRELLTESGEYSDAAMLSRDDLAYDADAGTKRGIPYYQAALDTLARKFAEVMNEANTLPDKVVYRTNDAGLFVDKEGHLIEYVPDGDGNMVQDRSKFVLKDEYSYYDGGALFSNSGNSDDTEGITAANLSISHSWAHGSIHVLQSTEENAPSRANDNLAHIIATLTKDHEFVYGSSVSGVSSFKGTFQEMLTDTIAGTLAKDQNITDTMRDNYNTTADELYVDRDAIMGVDLNDEAMNMMQFQKAYSAACRLMTTYDGMLEKLINGTAV